MMVRLTSETARLKLDNYEHLMSDLTRLTITSVEGRWLPTPGL